MDAFNQTKAQILANLVNGLDWSPKGSVDIPVRDFVAFINSLNDYVTTSSCSGRVTVSYLLGENKGVHWTLVKHGFVTADEVSRAVLQESSVPDALVTLKCEPFIMHVCCRSEGAAKRMHEIAMECGFRESGITLGNRRTMLAIRTTSFSLEVPVGRNAAFLFESSASSSASPYVKLLVEEANNRLRQNFARADRLLHMMKTAFGYPQLSLRPRSSMTVSNNSSAIYSSTNSLSHLWNRFGHLVLSFSHTPADFMIIGGQGQESACANVGDTTDALTNSKTKSVHCGRKVTHFTWNEFIRCKSRGDKLSKSDPFARLAHLPEMMHSRGAAVQLEGSSLLLLSGGRQSPQSPPLPLIHAYIEMEGIFQVVPTVIHVGELVPSSRWGHSFVQLTDSTFLLCGGRDFERVFEDCFLGELHLDSNRTEGIKLTMTWTALSFSHCAPFTNRDVFARYFHATTTILAEDESVYDEHLGCLQILLHGGSRSLLDPTDLAQQSFVLNVSTKTIRPVAFLCQSSRQTVACPPRIGHTLTILQGKTAVLVGGIGIDSCDTDSAFGAVLWHFGGNSSVSEVFSIGVQPVDLSSSPLPCAQCRAHHQTHFDSSHSLLHLIGGGDQSLAFGDHHCASLLVTVHAKDEVPSLPKELQSNNDPIKILSSTSAKRSSSAIAGFSQDDSGAVLASPQAVKALKTLFESWGAIDTSKKIFKTDFSQSNIAHLQSVVLVCNSDSSSLTEKGDSTSLMAIPLTASYYQLLCSDRFTDSEQARAIAQVTKCSNIFVGAVNLLRSGPITEIPATMQKSIEQPIASAPDNETAEPLTTTTDSKVQFKRRQPCVTNPTKAKIYLETLVTNEDIFVDKEAAKKDIPTKFELVGDILMIPEKAFAMAEWRSYIEANTEKVWKGLAACFAATRVARKALVHSGPMRQSQVQLLFVNRPVQDSTTKKKKCICGEDHSVLDGWVTVPENKIKFSFDITRVMFCSGNNTERMRMGSLRIPGEVVVDFYCGIGYYTVPLLAYSQLKFLYALEWNKDSIYSLKHNLAKAGIASDRYSIRFGDNRQTSVDLVDVADRILLGLLPSSVQGWPLAARALKASGGIIHVHENVHERDIEKWILDMQRSFEVLFAENKKPLNTRILHVEIVKSYAPKVYHYVIDMLCYQ